MTISERLIEFVKKSPKEADTPEGFCPNCWGREEYGGKFYEAILNNRTDIDDKDSKIGWVQEYANKHLLSIALENQGEEMACPKCKMNYKVES